MEPAYATLLSRLRALGIRPENRSETELATIWDAYLEGLVQHDHHNALTPEERAYDERHAQLEELQSASIRGLRIKLRVQSITGGGDISLSFCSRPCREGRSTGRRVHAIIMYSL